MTRALHSTQSSASSNNGETAALSMPPGQYYGDWQQEAVAPSHERSKRTRRADAPLDVVVQLDGHALHSLGVGLHNV